MSTNNEHGGTAKGQSMRLQSQDVAESRVTKNGLGRDITNPGDLDAHRHCGMAGGPEGLCNGPRQIK